MSGLTVLLTTHGMGDIETLCRSGVVLSLLQFGFQDMPGDEWLWPAASE